MELESSLEVPQSHSTEGERVTPPLHGHSDTATLLRRRWALFYHSNQSKFRGVGDMPRATRLVRVKAWMRPRHWDSTSTVFPSRSRASHVERAMESRGRPETTKGPMSPHCQQWSAGAHMPAICSTGPHQNSKHSQHVGKCSEHTRMRAHTHTRSCTCTHGHTNMGQT